MIKTLEKLLKNPPTDDSWIGEEIQAYNKYYLCVDKKKSIYFCIVPSKIDEAISIANSTRGAFTVFRFGFKKTITIKGKAVNKETTFIQLINPIQSPRFTERFTEDCLDIIEKFGDDPVYEDLINHLDVLRQIHMKLVKKRDISELGLWGELFLISNSVDKKEAIESWHMSASEIYDFNNGKNITEVKTTIKPERKHKISQDQINDIKAKKSSLISIMTAPIDSSIGVSVNHLIEEIKEPLKENEKSSFIDKLEVLAGIEYLNYKKSFDRRLAEETLRSFDYDVLQRIEPANIPASILKIEFTINLENIKAKPAADFNTLEKNLLN